MSSREGRGTPMGARPLPLAPMPSPGTCEEGCLWLKS